MSQPLLDILWDEAKALSNLAKHGVTFAQAAAIMLYLARAQTAFLGMQMCLLFGRSD